MTDIELQEAPTLSCMDTVYTSSNGKKTKLGELPLPYLRNIKNKMDRMMDENETTSIYQDICMVIDAKDAEVKEAEAAAQAALSGQSS